MSAIYFTSPSAEVKLSGAERAHAAILTANLTFAAFFPTGHARDPLFEITPFHQEKYQRFGGALEFKRDLELFLAVRGSERFKVVGRLGPTVFDVCLNTALALGGDVVKLLARLHGQCELHAWVDGPNRSWLARIIAKGLDTRILRDGFGWEKVWSFLLERDDESVVTSYSACDCFPNHTVAGCSEVRWNAMSREAQWEVAMQGLKDRSGTLELRPESWRYPDLYFGDGDTAMSLLASVREKPEEDPFTVQGVRYDMVAHE